MKIYLHALSLFVLLFLYGLGSAAPVAIGDASFEGNTLTSGQANSNLSPEWQVVAGGAGFFFGNEVFTAGFAADGTDHLALLSGDQVWQDLGETFQANTVYTLKVAVGALAGFTEASNSSTYALGVGGTIYATASYNASQLAAGSFADAPDLVFDTAANPAVVGQPIRITLSAGGGGETYFDHLRLTTSFSQPAGTAVAFAPSVSNLDLFSVSLSGVMLDVGDSDPVITFFYGTADGGNKETDWDASVTLPGTQAVFSSFSTNLTSLQRDQTYFVRIRALNSAGESWSQSVTSFTTPDGTPVIASVDAAPAPLGDLTTIFWQVDTALTAPLTSLTLDQGVGDILALTDATGAGSVQVTVTDDVVFTLTAETAYGFDASSVEVQAIAPKITEFVANTSSGGLRDEDAEVNDWIELHNSANVSADLTSYYLTDDVVTPNKWAFPAVTLAPDAYVVVFASGKDRRPTIGELHTNFSLSSGGEYLALTRDDGNGGFIIVQEFAPNYPEQSELYSYGFDANGEVFYFRNPSPGILNRGDGVEGFVEDTNFDVDRGFYSAPFDLTISSLTADAVIRYTTDGSEPTATTGSLYTGPIPINQTTIIRAAAFKEGYRPTDVDTQTYLFPADIITQPTMRTNITQDAVYGPKMQQSLKSIPTLSLSFQGDLNYDERMVSIEMINFEVENTQIDAGIERFGGYITDFAKRSFRLNFRKEFGARKLSFPLFAGHSYGISPAEIFDSIECRAGNHDMSQRGAYLSGRFVDDSMMEMGHLAPHGRFVHIYQNGVYWGQYHLRERWNAAMLSEYYGGSKEDYEAVNANNVQNGLNRRWDNFGTGTPYDGTGHYWNETQELLNGAAPFTSVGTHLDIVNTIDFTTFWSSGDAESEFRSAGSVPLGVPFKFFMKDPDGFLRAPFRSVNHSGPLDALAKFRAEGNPDYNILVADRIHKHYFNDGVLTPSKMVGRLSRWVEETRLSFLSESARWNYRSPVSWENYQEDLLTQHLPYLTDIMVDKFRAAGIYPALSAPYHLSKTKRIESGAFVQAVVPSDGTHIYYMIGLGDSDSTNAQDDLDPRLSGGGVNPAASVVAVPSGSQVASEVEFISSGDFWQYLDDGSDQGELWREVGFDDGSWNSGASQLGYGDGDETTLVNGGILGQRHATTYFRKQITIPDPSAFADFKLSITYDDSYVVYLNGVEVARHAGLLEPSDFNTYSGSASVDNAVDELSISPVFLTSGSNLIAVEIHQASPSSSDMSFDFELTGRPAATAETITLSLPDSINASSWVKSRTYNANTGEWSALNQAFFTTISELADTTNLVISEVHYHPLDPTAAELAVDPTFGSGDFEFIEIMNISNQTVDLSGAAFVKIPVGNDLDGVEFTFPDGAQIAPGGRQVIVANAAAFAARYPGVAIAGEYSSGLSNKGEWVTLVDAEGEIIDSFRYNDKAPWPVTADGDGYSLVLNNPASQPNPADPSNWSASQDIGGSPGASDGKTFTGDPLADLDGDGRIAILEYAQGNSDDEANNGETLKLEMTALSGENYATVSYREDPSASDVSLLLETSTDLTSGSWTTNSSALEFIETTADPDGIPRHTYRTVNPVDLSTRRFFRLKVVY